MNSIINETKKTYDAKTIKELKENIFRELRKLVIDDKHEAAPEIGSTAMSA